MAKIIKLIDSRPTIVNDEWVICREPAFSLAVPQKNKNIVPFSKIKDIPVESWEQFQLQAVWLSPDDDLELLAPFLHGLSMIAVDFPSFRDGRGYSMAYLLRSRYEWKGELRATGDVLRDQLNYMRRCGFDAFAVRADKSVEDALKSFDHYSVQYQATVDTPLPLFKRRRAA